MGRVNHSLDELEESMKATEIQEDDLDALREKEKRHQVKTKIKSEIFCISSIRGRLAS